MTFNPKWHDQADEMRREGINIFTVRATQEIAKLKRRRRGDALLALGATVTVIGLSLLFTDWFGAGLVTAVIGFVVAVVGEEMGK